MCIELYPWPHELNKTFLTQHCRVAAASEQTWLSRLNRARTCRCTFSSQRIQVACQAVPTRLSQSPSVQAGGPGNARCCSSHPATAAGGLDKGHFTNNPCGKGSGSPRLPGHGDSQKVSRREKDACLTQCLGAMASDAARVPCEPSLLSTRLHFNLLCRLIPRSSRKGTSMRGKVPFKPNHAPVPGLAQEEVKSTNRAA